MIDLDKLEAELNLAQSNSKHYVVSPTTLNALIAIARAARIFERYTSTSNRMALVEALKAIKAEEPE
jgi:hypothetical protein